MAALSVRVRLATRVAPFWAAPRQRAVSTAAAALCFTPDFQSVRSFHRMSAAQRPGTLLRPAGSSLIPAFRSDAGVAPQQPKATVFSWMKDKMTSSMQEKQEAKSKAFMEEMMFTLWKARKVDIKFYVDHIKKRKELVDLDGWKKHLPGSDHEIVQNMKKFMDIAVAIPAQLHNVEEFDGEGKRLTMEATGATADQMRNVIQEYDQLRVIHFILQLEKKEQGKIPKTQDEVGLLMTKHRPKLMNDAKMVRLMKELTGANNQKKMMAKKRR